MDLLRYFKKKGGLPDPTGPLSSHKPSPAIVRVNRLVQAAQCSRGNKTRGSYIR